MKAALVLTSALLIAFAAMYVAAQPALMPDMPTMAQMHGPFSQSFMTAFLLPALQPELNLSTAQVAQLKQFRQEFLAKERELGAQVKTKTDALTAAIDRDTPKPAEVKTLIEQLAKLRGEQQFAGYEAASRMKSALIEEQRNRFASLKPAELRQAMMRTTVSEMNEMMQLMAPEGMMPAHMMNMNEMMRMMGMMGMMNSNAMSPGMMEHKKK